MLIVCILFVFCANFSGAESTFVLNHTFFCKLPPPPPSCTQFGQILLVASRSLQSHANKIYDGPNRPFWGVFSVHKWFSWPNGRLSPIACHTFPESSAIMIDLRYLEIFSVHLVIRQIFSLWLGTEIIPSFETSSYNIILQLGYLVWTFFFFLAYLDRTTFLLGLLKVECLFTCLFD